MRFPREQGWAHFRNTMSEPFSGRRTSSIPGLLFVDDDSAGGAGGGGGGGAGSGAGGGEGGDNAGGAGGGADEAAKNKAEQDRKLAAEAANWRTKLRSTEKDFGDFKTAAQTQIEALKAEIEEIKSRGTAESTQGDQSGKGKPSPEVDALNRKVKELSDSVRTEREIRLKQENQLKTEKISGRIKDMVVEGKFRMPKVLVQLLTDKVDVASDGAIILKVPNEAGGTDEVPATLENLTKYRPVSDFDEFLPTTGASGAGSRGGNSNAAGDGIDWNKVRAGDLDYIAKNNPKIKAAMAAGNAHQ